MLKQKYQYKISITNTVKEYPNVYPNIVKKCPNVYQYIYGNENIYVSVSFVSQI